MLSLLSGVALVCRFSAAGCVGAVSPSAEKSVGVRQVWRHLQEGGGGSRVRRGEYSLCCCAIRLLLEDDRIRSTIDAELLPFSVPFSHRNDKNMHGVIYDMDPTEPWLTYLNANPILCHPFSHETNSIK